MRSVISQISSQLEGVQHGLVVLNQSRTTFGAWLTLLGDNTIHSAAPVPSPSGDLMSPDWSCWCQPIAELATSPLVSQTPAWVSCSAEKCFPHSEFKSLKSLCMICLLEEPYKLSDTNRLRSKLMSSKDKIQTTIFCSILASFRKPHRTRVSLNTVLTL